MSVLVNLAMFPTDKGESVSHHVSRVVKQIKKSGVSYQLTSMGTLIETETLTEALALVDDAYRVLEEDCDRVYLNMTIDIRKGKSNRMESKVKSVKEKIKGKD